MTLFFSPFNIVSPSLSFSIQFDSAEYLELFFNQLSGPIPTEIGLLTALVNLALDSNQLSGPIPTEIGLLTALVNLALDGNQLSGPIPTEIGLLTSLTDLALFDNQLSGPIPSELEDLSQLGKYVWTFDRQFAFVSSSFFCD